MNSDFITARRALFGKRVLNLMSLVITDPSLYSETYSNHPSCDDFEHHFSYKTSKGNSFRIIFTGFHTGLSIHCHFLKEVSKNGRLFIYRTPLKSFLSITDIQIMEFANEVDIFQGQIDQLYLTMKGEAQ